MLIVRTISKAACGAVGMFLVVLLTPSTLEANLTVNSDSITIAWDAHNDPAVVGYVVHYGTQSGVYSSSIDVAASTSVILSGLTSGTTYYAAVSAYTLSSQESPVSGEICFTVDTDTPANQGGLVLLEPEKGIVVDPMVVGVEFDPSDIVLSLGPSSTYVMPLGGGEGGSAGMNFSVPVSGDYYVWCRVKAPDADSDSFFYSVDGSPDQVFNVYESAPAGSVTYTDAWVWSRIDLPSGQPFTANLTEGPHSILFRQRETDIKLDVVVLTSDSVFVPSDALPREGDVVILTTRMNSQEVEEGAPIELSVTATATGTATYQWYKDGVPIPGMTEPVLNIPNFQGNHAGAYSVVATSGSATTTSDTAVLTLVGSPTINTMDLFSVGPRRFVVFDIGGHRGSTIEVQASDDLQNWYLLDTQINNAGMIAVDDPAAVLGPQRYYRLFVP